MHIKERRIARFYGRARRWGGGFEMDMLKEREAAAEAIYIHRVEAAFADRLERIQRLGAWACGLMKVGPSDEERYQDILYRLAISSLDDRVLVNRVYDDLAVAGVSTSLARIRDVFGQKAAKAHRAGAE